MLEIIALILLTRHIGKVAERKGVKTSTWKLYTVLAWIAGEVAGIIAGIIFFGNDMVSLMLMGIAGAVTGYLILKSALDKKPDNFDDDINRIGVDDLRP